MRTLILERALLPSGWASRVRVEIAGAHITSVEADSPAESGECVTGTTLPGMPNAHSHAFQRAFAGLAERRGGGDDSFWTWRDAMYRVAGTMTPELVRIVAAQLYSEMLAAGYTSVAEFHYLHHQPDGTPYPDATAMADALIAAAEDTGIGLTLLPVLYQHSGFGGQTPKPEQRRFVNSVDGLFSLIEALGPKLQGRGKVGLALHSLRAVAVPDIAEAAARMAALDPAAPIHIHVAEQIGEVEDCLAWSGRRPVELLLDAAGVDARWCFVHATHLTGSEVEGIAASGATVALCPTTEANLGDGLFPLEPFVARGGSLAIGSDSHITVDPFEELRWLEYGQRLHTLRRSIVTDEAGPHPGAQLWRRALEGGARACGHGASGICPGARADLLVVDAGMPGLLVESGDALLDSLVFAAPRGAIRQVMAGGEWRVSGGRHVAQDAIARAFMDAVGPIRRQLSVR